MINLRLMFAGFAVLACALIGLTTGLFGFIVGTCLGLVIAKQILD